MGISLRPSGFTTGGGLLDDVDVTFTEALFGYGYGKEGSGAEAVTLQIKMMDGDGTEHQSFYSVGQGFVPSEPGGEELVPVGDKTALNGGSNAALFLNSLVNAGLPEDLLDGAISAINGTKVHVNRVAAPKRGNLPKREGPNADREQTVLLVTTVISLPGEKPKAAAKGAKPAAGKPAAATKAASTEDTDDLVMELMGVFSANDGAPMKKVDIVKALFKSVEASNPNKKAILAQAGKAEVLSALEGFTFDGTTLTQD